MSQSAHTSTSGAGGVGPARRSGWILPIRGRAAPLALTIFGLASVVIRIHQTGKMATPFLLCDEFIYAGVARNLAATGGFQWRGQDLVINPPPFQAVVHVWPTSSPGTHDPRLLRARVSFRFVPPRVPCPAAVGRAWSRRTRSGLV